MRLRLPRRSLAAVAALAASLIVTSSAFAIDEVNTKKLRKNVTVNGILQHERAFQSIANMNGGTRASGTAGYDASAAYVTRRLRQAGYRVRQQEFEFVFFEELADPQLQQVSPNQKDYETATFSFSGSGDVTAPLQEVNDNQFPPPAQPGSTAGCEPEDFTGFTAGNVALIQRGSCTFAQKAENAEQAGASAVIIFNEGQPGRTDVVAGTLGGDSDIQIPVVGASFADGEELHNLLEAGEVTVHVFTSTVKEPRETVNVLADSRSGDSDQTVVVGAHLDSVLEGPGINDNGSGSATILEIAEELDELGKKFDRKQRRKLRFAFWGAEENGLIGSEHYVEQLGPRRIGDIYANLNFDMVGSPNYVRFVYDGDGSDSEPAGPPGSAQIEAIFNQYFASQGQETDPTPFNGRSDYGPFIAVGIPAGGLFTGAEGIKTAEQAAVYGGTAGIAYDPNYHQAGDTINNLSTKALSEMSDGAADATLTVARSKTGFFEDGSRVKGSRKKKGKKKVKSRTFEGPHAKR